VNFRQPCAVEFLRASPPARRRGAGFSRAQLLQVKAIGALNFWWNMIFGKPVCTLGSSPTAGLLQIVL
jgi:hypothetical protein